MNIETLKLQIETFRKTGLDISHLQQQLDKLQPNEQPIALDNAQDVGNETSENEPAVDIQEPTPESKPKHELPANETTPPSKAAPDIQDTEAQEKELDEDIDEPPEIQKIAVAPAIENHQSAWTLACCYLWLTSKNMNERKGVMFNTPRPFQELANKNLWHEVPDQAEWTTWNRIHGCGLDNFLTSKGSIEEYKQALKEVMCTTPHWWREKYLATSELSTK